ncbi:hypothetical protein [Microscilla marina]|uniref:Uncharacterized protein n=1 Tax=Microscilla marina ATCC 23134 TaxID=313606 RepID=A1ZQL9_MICM2|nr:hypothetical protein [Microscilla marina]EAY27391.1 hypothetical protein M23134_08343 [Microscilla marina ATCC 23134]
MNIRKYFSHAFALVALLVIGTYTTQAQTTTGFIELGNGTHPGRIDFKNDGSDFDARLQLINDNQLRLTNADFLSHQSMWVGRDLILYDGTVANGVDLWQFHHSGNNQGLYIGRDPVGSAANRWEFLMQKNGVFHAKKLVIDGSVPGILPSGYMVAVDGKGLFEEIHLQNSSDWPDYVFANDYKLPSLKDTEAFIKQNQHLPEVPSAKVVAADGYDVGGMTKILLKKIEELTLHTIAQQKEIEALKKAQLKK